MPEQKSRALSYISFCLSLCVCVFVHVLTNVSVSMTGEKCRASDRKREGQSSERRVCVPLTPVTTAYCEDLLLNTSSVPLTPQLGFTPSHSRVSGHGLERKARDGQRLPRKKARRVLQSNMPSRTDQSSTQRGYSFKPH